MTRARACRARLALALAGLAFLASCTVITTVFDRIEQLFAGQPAFYVARIFSDAEREVSSFEVQRVRVVESREGAPADVRFEGLQNRVLLERTAFEFDLSAFSVREDGQLFLALLEEDIDPGFGAEETIAIFADVPGGRVRQRILDGTIARLVADTCFEPEWRPVLDQELPVVAEEGSFDPDQPYSVAWSALDPSGRDIFSFSFLNWTDEGFAAFEFFATPVARVTQNGNVVRNSSGDDTFTLFQGIFSFTINPTTGALVDCTRGTAAPPPPAGPFTVSPRRTARGTVFDIQRPRSSAEPLFQFPAVDPRPQPMRIRGVVETSRVLP